MDEGHGNSHSENQRGRAAPAPGDGASATIAFNKAGCLGMLRKHPRLKERIEQTIRGQMANRLFKSKHATNARWRNLPIWECRVNEKSVGSVRTAFVVHGSSATVLLISSELQKRAFTAELEGFLERSRG